MPTNARIINMNLFEAAIAINLPSRSRPMYSTPAQSPATFASMTTYYCRNMEEALQRAKAAGKRPGCFYGGIVLRSGKKGFAVYREGKVVEQYSAYLSRKCRTFVSMKVCVIGGANVDITAASFQAFRPGDSNPGRVHVSWGGVGRNIAHNLVLLGDEVELLTIFGGGLFGPVIEAACRDIGIGTKYTEIAAEGTNSYFVSINDADGEMLGGVADMRSIEGMDAAWLGKRLPVINASDAVVADSNLSPEALAFLIDHCTKPLYLDAVSVAKAARIREAVERSEKKTFFALKCNALEAEILADLPGVERFYETAGADGLKVHADGKTEAFPALPTRVVNVTGGGDALLAGIVHAGPGADIQTAARWGLACARCAVESKHAVSEEIKNLKRPKR